MFRVWAGLGCSRGSEFGRGCWRQAVGSACTMHFSVCTLFLADPSKPEAKQTAIRAISWMLLHSPNLGCYLGASWAVINGVISPFDMGYNYSHLAHNPSITTHEPPSREVSQKACGFSDCHVLLTGLGCRVSSLGFVWACLHLTNSTPDTKATTHASSCLSARPSVSPFICSSLFHLHLLSNGLGPDPGR